MVQTFHNYSNTHKSVWCGGGGAITASVCTRHVRKVEKYMQSCSQVMWDEGFAVVVGPPLTPSLVSHVSHWWGPPSFNLPGGICSSDINAVVLVIFLTSNKYNLSNVGREITLHYILVIYFKFK